MQPGLKGELLSIRSDAEHPTGDVVLTEPNGDTHLVTCIALPEFTRLEGDGEMLDYLNERYGDRTVCFTARDLVVAASRGGSEPTPGL